MTRVGRALRRIAEDLDASGHAWCLIGGLAVSARAEPRTTRDVDVIVAVASDAEAESLVFLLQAAGYRLETVIEQTLMGRLATARLLPPDEIGRGALVDLLFASSGIEAEIAAAAERRRVLPNLTIPVATVGHLIALKVLAHDARRRPQDHDDIRALLREATEADLEQARSALRLVEARGGNRGKPLLAEMERLTGSSAGSHD
jgi:hypothetical protein